MMMCEQATAVGSRATHTADVDINMPVTFRTHLLLFVPASWCLPTPSSTTIDHLQLRRQHMQPKEHNIFQLTDTSTHLLLSIFAAWFRPTEDHKTVDHLLPRF